MNFGVLIIKGVVQPIKRQINRYYTAKLQTYSKQKNITLSTYLKIVQFHPALLVCSILLTTYCHLMPIVLLILLMLIEELTIILLVIAFRHNFDYLNNVEWHKMSEATHSCLQLIKYSRMIELGYELRANTNIMLHDEIQHSLFQFKQFNERQFKLQMEISKIHKLLTDLFTLLNLHFPIKSKCLNQIRQLQYSLTFKTIFELNHNFGIIFDRLQNTIKLYTSFVSNQLNKFIKIVYLTYFIRFPFRNSLKDISKSLKIIEQQIQAQIKSGQNSKLYHSLKKQQEYQELQSIFCRFKYTNQIKNEQKTDRVDQIIEINACQQKEIKKETIQPNQNSQQNYQQRKNFMAKLDSLLIIGLARKRQEELQQKLRMQQYIQEKIQTKLPIQ